MALASAREIRRQLGIAGLACRVVAGSVLPAEHVEHIGDLSIGDGTRSIRDLSISLAGCVSRDSSCGDRSVAVSGDFGYEPR